MGKKALLPVLLIVPLIFLITGLRFDRTKYGTDPESAYLLNGLNIAQAKSVGHFDNPGTTVQTYCAVVIRITYLFRSTDNDIQTDVLTNSEFYIEVIRKSLIAMNALILLLLGAVTLYILNNLWAALLLQISPFLSVTLIEECFTKVAPEPVLFAATSVLIMLLLKYYYTTEINKNKYSLWFGILMGFGLATKMTFLPMLIIPFMVLSGKRNKWKYVLMIIPAFVLFTLPAIKGYPSMAKWFLNLGTHTGTYGQGNTGLIDPFAYFNSLKSIMKNNLTMVIALILAMAVWLSVFLNSDKKKRGNEFYLLSALLVAMAGSILLVAKHYHSNHYLFPALSLTGFILLSVSLLIGRFFSANQNRALKITFPVITALVLLISLFNIPNLTLAYEGYRLSNQSTDETFQRLDKEYQEYVKVYYYPISFNEYSSLRWGDVYSRQYSNDKLLQLFPDGLFYNAWDKSFQLWESNIPTKEFVKRYGTRFLLVGGPKTNEEIKIVEDAGLKLNKLFESRVQVVYEIDSASKFFESAKAAPKWSLSNDFEKSSPDGQWILNENGMDFCKSSGITTDKAHSGSHAFKLPWANSYAMDYLQHDIKVGQTYEITSWCYGELKDFNIVATDGVQNSFYQAGKTVIENDPNGWKKISIGFIIPDSFKGNTLKIYFWNNGNNPVWCDDFEISRF